MKFIKLLSTTGLVRKKVLVRKKGSKPFWSTRWISQGQDIKEVVESLGYEVVEEEKRVSTGRVKLQGWGDSPSIEADKVRIGDVQMFNYSETQTIIGIEQKSPKTLLFTYEEKDNEGNNYTDSRRMTSKVVIKELYDAEMKMDREKRKEREKQREKVVIKPEPKVIISKPKVIISIPESKVTIDFIPAKNINDANERINKFITIKGKEITHLKTDYGINFEGLKLDGLNSILMGFEKSFSKYDIKLDYIGFNPRKQNVAAKYEYYHGDIHNSIQFQKTATKNVKKRREQAKENFEYNKKDNIEKMHRYLTYKEMRPGDHDRDRAKIAKYEACKRFTVDVDVDDMLAATTVHECNHAIYYKYKLESKWKDNLTYLVGDKMNNDLKCASVSEYGMSSIVELFAEVGTAITFGVDIDPNVKQAYLDTIRGINR